MTDTTDLADRVDSAPAGQDEPRGAAPRTRRRATSGGLAAKVLPELQAMAGELGISGTGRMRKSQLIEAIQAKQGAAPADSSVEPSSPEPSSPEPSSPEPSSPEPSRSESSSPKSSGPAQTAPRADRSRRSAAASGESAPAEARSRSASRASSDGGASSGKGVDQALDDDDAAARQRPDTRDRGPRTEPTDDDAERSRPSTDASADGGDGDGERPERIDRGRERFLEREARRQERASAAVAGPDEPTEAGRDGDAADRPTEQNDRQGQAAPADDDDRADGRRGRFRERGRNRNRNRSDRFDRNEPDPVLGDDDVLLPVGGILDILENYGFVRTSGYLTGPNDVYVSMQQVRRYSLRRGDAITGAVRQQRDGERRDKYNALVRLDSVNGQDPEESKSRPDFTKLTPLYPQERLRLETEPGLLTTRVIDLVTPMGKGQRALIVSPPKAGKTMVLQAIANAITTNNPECHLMVVLVDERPEEVTDMQRSVKGEVIASTFDRPPTDHITVAELSIERAKRLVELGHDVVVLLDSITRLGRAYNLGAPASGRILTGGVDSAALYPPKRFLGAARNIENGGSLTIVATALVETGSAMDTVIFEEFKGTGNAELRLDRRLADKRIFPAIDVDASGTRKEELLLSPEELRIVLQLRRVLHTLDTSSGVELLLEKIKSTRTNVEFLMQIQKTTPSADADRA